MTSSSIDCLYTRLVQGIMIEIQSNGLMSRNLKQFFDSSFSDLPLPKPKPKPKPSTINKQNTKEMVSEYCYLVEEMFKGVVSHTHCLMVSKRMVRIIKKHPHLELEEACRQGAHEINMLKDKTIFPMDEETFNMMMV